MTSYFKTCASHNFISPSCFRRLEQKYSRIKEYDYDFKRSKKRVNIKFGNNDTESHDVFSYDILVKLINKNKNKEICFLKISSNLIPVLI
jgi:hypothetical protein